MTRRRRLARLLDRLAAWLFGPYVEPWAPVTQAHIDADIAEWAKRNR
jgi:hypothetical protein